MMPTLCGKTTTDYVETLLAWKLTIFWIARPRITFCKKIKASSSSSSNWKTREGKLVRSNYALTQGKWYMICCAPFVKKKCKVYVHVTVYSKNYGRLNKLQEINAFFTCDGTSTDGVGGRGIGFSTFTKNLSGFSGSGGLLANSITFATSSNSLWRRCFLFTNPPFPLDFGFGAWILGCVTKSGRDASSSNRPW